MFRTVRMAIIAINRYYGFEPKAKLKHRDIHGNQIYNSRYIVLARQSSYELWRFVDYSGKVAICAKTDTLKAVMDLIT